MTTYIVIAVAIALALWKGKIPYEVRRAKIIDASEEDVFNTVINFKEWGDWSPWTVMEPETKVSVSGTGLGVGDVYSWDGRLTGMGEVEHLRLVSPHKVEDDLRFLKPWKSTAKVFWTIEPKAGGTEAEWRMTASMPLFMAWMIPMMKTWIAQDYERGLKMLKDKVENGVVYTTVEDLGVVDAPEIHYLGIKGTCSFDDISSSMEEAYMTLFQLMEEKGITMTGAPLSIYNKWDMKNERAEFTSAFPVAAGTTVDHERVESGTILATKALKIRHTGAYHHLGNAWSMGMMQLQCCKDKKKSSQSPYEIYTTDPQTTEEKDAVAEIYMPLK